MPSYRCTLTIVALLPGCDPAQVELAARASLPPAAVLERFQIDVVRAQAQVTIRFAAADDATAQQAQQAICAALRGVAQTDAVRLAKVVRGRFVALPAS